MAEFLLKEIFPNHHSVASKAKQVTRVAYMRHFRAQIPYEPFDSQHIHQLKVKEIPLFMLHTANVCCACVHFSFFFRLKSSSSVVNFSLPTKTSSSFPFAGALLELDKSAATQLSCGLWPANCATMLLKSSTDGPDIFSRTEQWMLLKNNEIYLIKSLHARGIRFEKKRE